MRLPAVLGEYRLVEQLGVGAFGNVYRAEVLGDLGFSKEVAIKLLDPLRVSDVPAVVSAFADEAGFLSKIHHPNIIKVLQFKEISHEFLGETFLMVCELVRGQTLRDLLTRLRKAGTRMPLEALVLLLTEAVDALRYAHSLKTPSGKQLGLVHRDLKPENLMVSENGYLKILDFGIAWAGERLSGQTVTQMTKGTPLYMSPEQLRGLQLDGRSDLYSLGLIAFELICLEQYVVEPSTGTVDLPALVHAAATTTWEDRYPVLRDALRSPQGYGLDDVPAQALENLVGWLVSPLPANRPPNALTLLSPVEALQDTWKPSRGRRFFRESVGEWSTADDEAPIDFPLRTPTGPPRAAPAAQAASGDVELLSDDLVPALPEPADQHRAALEMQATVAPMVSSGALGKTPPAPALPEVSEEEAVQLFDGFDSHASLSPIGVTEVPLPESASMPMGPTRHMPAHSGMDPPAPLGALDQLASGDFEVEEEPDSEGVEGREAPPAPAGALTEFDRVTAPLKAVAVNLEEQRRSGSKRALFLLVGGGLASVVFLLVSAGLLVSLVVRWLGDDVADSDPLPIELSIEHQDASARSSSQGASEAASVASDPMSTPGPGAGTRTADTGPGSAQGNGTQTDDAGAAGEKRPARSRRKRASRKRPSNAKIADTGRSDDAPKVTSPSGAAPTQEKSAGSLWDAQNSKAKPVRLRTPTKKPSSSSAWAKPPSMSPPVVSSLQVPPAVAPGGTYEFELSLAEGEASCAPKLWISPNGKKFVRKGMRHLTGGRYERTLSLPVGSQWARGLYYYVGCCWGESGPCSPIMYTQGAPAFVQGTGIP